MSREAQVQPQQRVYESNIKNVAKCRWCRGMNIVKKGYRKTEKRGKIQRYICKDCNRSFCIDEGFYRMRNNEKKITMSIDMYLSNLSSRKMRNQLLRHFNYKISHVTVLDWVRKYVLKVQEFIEKHKPSLSGKIYADETDIPRGCNTKKRGGDKFWCSVDWDTRYINATMYSPNPQNINEAISFLKNIKKKCMPKYVQTDSAQFYPKAMKKVFSVHKHHPERTQHIINNVSKTGKHNVRIETVFSKIKDRVDDFRGLKALWSAPILLAGIILQHNIIESHTTTGVRPCDLAGLKFNVGDNRWLGLIKLAST